MKINTSVLKQYIDLPADPRAIRMLLDDIGIEVKRQDPESGALTLELLANRGDHHCYTGIAREIAGRTGSGVCGPSFAELTVGPAPHPLQIETDLCGLYSATILERSGTESPLTADEQAPLDAAEIHSITPAIDATNLANLEFGQPTHCFDADTIVGAVTIRLSRAGEQAWPLFSEERVTVPEGSIVIADDEKILAIAGVIGCEESKTTESTQRILLESAAFDPVAVRKASRSLSIHTDSSARFERGSDPSQVLIGAGRVVHLLEAHGWSRSGDTGLVGQWTDEARSISLQTSAASAFLDHPLTDDDIIERLSRYGFGVSGDAGALSVTIPPHRAWDVEHAADLYEELAKSIGYNDTATTLPAVDMGALPSANDTMKATVEEVLLGAGFYEVFTNGFHGVALRDRLGLPDDHPLQRHVQTTNALDRGYGLVKNNCLAQAVEALAGNIRVGTQPIQMYEWTRTFHPDPTADNGVCRERHHLWAIACGSHEPTRWAGKARQTTAWRFKGLVEEIGVALGLPLSVVASLTDHPLAECLHPGRQAAVQLNGETVGIIGEVHPRITKAFKLKRNRPVYMDIDRNVLLTPPHPKRFKERSVHQPILRSLAFSLPPKVTAGAVADVLRECGPDWLETIAMVDLFEHEEDGTPMRAVTFSLQYGNTSGDRSAEAVNQASESLIEAVDRALGPQGVRLRA